MPTTSFDHAFDIGDLVANAGWEQLNELYEPQPFLVVEIRFQRCYGGLQVHYLCRPLVLRDRPFGRAGSLGVTMDLVDFVQAEVVAYPEELKHPPKPEAETADKPQE